MRCEAQQVIQPLKFCCVSPKIRFNGHLRPAPDKAGKLLRLAHGIGFAALNPVIQRNLCNLHRNYLLFTIQSFSRKTGCPLCRFSLPCRRPPVSRYFLPHIPRRRGTRREFPAEPESLPVSLPHPMERNSVSLLFRHLGAAAVLGGVGLCKPHKRLTADLLPHLPQKRALGALPCGAPGPYKKAGAEGFLAMPDSRFSYKLIAAKKAETPCVRRGLFRLKNCFSEIPSKIFRKSDKNYTFLPLLKF